MASTYLKRTGTTTVNTYTFSAWIKLGTLSSANDTYQVLFSSGNQNILGLYGGSTASGHNALYHYNNSNLWWTNNLLRDPSSWYHVVAKVSGGTVTTYINGVQTSYATSTYSLGALETTTDKTCVGCYAPSATSFFRGSMSHVHFISGTAYDPSAFGETDTTTGEWKAKTSPSVTYGADGFFILKDGNGITDQSGEGNNFTLGGGTLIDLKDNPDNNFATWNPLLYSKSTETNGNTTSASGSSGELNATSTLGMVGTGKYYMEFKRVSGNYPIFGIIDDLGMATHTSEDSVGLGKTGTTKSIGLRLNDGKTRVNNVVTTQGGAISNGDIVGVAVDKSTNKIYFSKNGQWSNGSGAWDSTTFNASTGATDVSSILTGDIWFFACGTDTSEANNTFSANFGNGYFGTTAVATNSGNGYSGAEGSSKFNYTVPTGYSALNTKGLNE
jgi:hypothetical protein